jgi:two-component system response regulator AtoC
MSAKQILLIVDDDAEYLSTLKRALAADFKILGASNVAEAQQQLNAGVNLALIDVRLLDSTEDRGGLELLRSIRVSHPLVPIVMMTNYADIDLAIEAMKLGAADFVQKARIDVREFRKVLTNVLAVSDLRRKARSDEERLLRHEPLEMVGDDPKLREIGRQIDVAAADSQVAVMIRGETGTGKELVARAIYARGPRRNKPFTALSITVLPRDLVASHLFGHVRGAFTGADQVRLGYLEQTQGGVLFLDEIGELDQDAQRALLRFLDTRTFARIGSTTEIKVDLQIVCATNLDLERAIEQGQFRADLYFRLKQMEIVLPPLRERAGDIPLLVDHFLFLLRQQGQSRVRGVSPAATAALQAYCYPGNIRELKNIVDNARMWAAANGHDVIELSDLPAEVTRAKSGANAAPAAEDGSDIDLKRAVALAELVCVEEALTRAGGRKGEAGRLLGKEYRHALPRLIKAIWKSHPELLAGFPLIREKYPRDE